MESALGRLGDVWVLEGEEEDGEILSCCLSAKQVHYKAGGAAFEFSCFSVTWKYFLSHTCLSDEQF